MAIDKRSPMGILFLVVLVDMLGLTLVIPFLTYFVQDLASAGGIVDRGERDFWVGIVIATYTGPIHLDTDSRGDIRPLREKAGIDVRFGCKLDLLHCLQSVW